MFSLLLVAENPPCAFSSWAAYILDPSLSVGEIIGQVPYLRCLLVVCQHIRKFIHKQLTDDFGRDWPMFPDQIQKQIPIVFIVKAPHSNMFSLPSCGCGNFTCHGTPALIACPLLFHVPFYSVPFYSLSFLLAPLRRRWHAIPIECQSWHSTAFACQQ